MIQHIPTSLLASPPCPLVLPSPGVLADDDIVTMICDDVICSIITMDFDIDVDSRGAVDVKSSSVMELDSVACDIDGVLDVVDVDTDDIDVIGDIDDVDGNITGPEIDVDSIMELESGSDMDSDANVVSKGSTDMDINGNVVVVMDDIDVVMDNIDDDIDGDIDVVMDDIDDDIREFVTDKNEEEKERLRSTFENPNSYERIYVALELIYSHFNPHTKFATCRCLQ